MALTRFDVSFLLKMRPITPPPIPAIAPMAEANKLIGTIRTRGILGFLSEFFSYYTTKIRYGKKVF